jgi:lipopolysaccharide transport system permease protein
MVRGAWRQRELLRQMVRREVVGRYRESIGGLAWSFLHPLLMLGVYTVFFGTILKTRWPQGNGGQMEFALVLFAGLTVHGLLSECINRAPGLILGNVAYVKQVVFPLEILPLVALGSALFHALISFLALLVFLPLAGSGWQWTLVFLPLVLLPLCLLSAGIGWLLAALGVYLRDIAQITQVISSILLFLSPVFFSLQAVPEPLRPLFLLNPLTYLIEETRNVLIWGNIPDLALLSVYTLACAVLAWLGFVVFQKSRAGFSDVI